MAAECVPPHPVRKTATAISVAEVRDLSMRREYTKQRLELCVTRNSQSTVQKGLRAPYSRSPFRWRRYLLGQGGTRANAGPGNGNG